MHLLSMDILAVARKSQLQSPHLNESNPIRAPGALLMRAQLAEGAECNHLLRTLQHTLRRRADEVHPPLAQLLHLRTHADHPAPARADQDTRAGEPLKRRFRARCLEYRAH